VEWYGKAARKGRPEGLLQQAIALSMLDDAESRRQSAEMIETLVEKNNAGAVREKALRFVKDPAQTVALLRKSAGLGDAAAMASLGDCHANGTGVTKDPAEAAAWYLKAAEKKNPHGQLLYANCLRDGLGVARNEAESAKWLRLAVARNHAPAQVEMGRLLLAQGPSKAAEAFKCFEKAADKDHPEGQYELGRCYENGIGVVRNPGEAVFWYRKSARADWPDGQVAYGRCLLHGVGVAPSRALARIWFGQAAKQGNQEAVKLLAE
jgi:TPR repeat protein